MSPCSHNKDHLKVHMLSYNMHELLFISGSSKVVKITGIAKAGRTVSIIVRGSNKLMLEEAARSLHDALCVIRCLVKKRFIIAGGGSPGTICYEF